MNCVQDIYDLCQGNVCNLDKGIYTAPLLISRPCTLRGNNSTIICGDDEKISVSQADAELHDITIECGTASQTDDVLLTCRSDTILKNVVTNGNIEIDGNLLDYSGIPFFLGLGYFRADEANTYSISVRVPCECTVTSDISDISVSPCILSCGDNNIIVRTGHIRDKTTIFGTISVTGNVTKKIIVSGHAFKNATVHNEFSNQDTIVSPVSRSEKTTVKAPAEVLPPECSEISAEIVKKGQRIQQSGKEPESFKISLTFGEKPYADIDGYVFILGANGKAASDSDLIFWGNKVSSDGTVSWIEGSNASYFRIETQAVSGTDKQIMVCYSIYGDKADEVFGRFKDPCIRIYTDDVEKYRFPLNDLSIEKTIVGVCVYSNKGKIKINCIGAGYRNGLRDLCESYGIEISD